MSKSLRLLFDNESILGHFYYKTIESSNIRIKNPVSFPSTIIFIIKTVECFYKLLNILTIILENYVTNIWKAKQVIVFSYFKYFVSKFYDKMKVNEYTIVESEVNESRNK